MKTIWKACGLLVLVGMFALLSAGYLWAQERRTIRVDHRIFPGLHMMHGNWSAIFVVSDGKVYVGLAHHRSDGHLVYYDPASDRIEDCGALTPLCGEALVALGPQSKIHTKFGRHPVYGTGRAEIETL